jgi:hypothetical protein
MVKRYIESRVKQISQRISDYPWIYALFSIGALLRISGFTVGEMWWDEIYSLEVTRQNLFEMINSLKLNISPPGLETLLWFVVRIFGWNAFSVRLLSVIASIASLWIMYKIGNTLKFTKGQLIAAMAMVALLPYQLVSAQQGRVYALFTMFYLTGLYAVLSKRWLVLGVSTAALFWCHNVSFMFVPGLSIIALFIHPRNWKRIILTFFLAVLAYIPWLGVTITIATKPIPWFSPLTLDYFINDFIVAFFGFNMPHWAISIGFVELLALCIGAVILPLAGWIFRDMRNDIDAIKTNHMIIKIWVSRMIARIIRAENSLSHQWSQWILFLAFSIPLSLLTLASIFMQNVLINRTASLLIIPFVMWLITIYVVPRPKIFHFIIWGVSILILLTGAITWSPTQLSGNIRNLEDTIYQGFRGVDYVPLDISANNYEPGDAFIHNTGITALVFNYYFPHTPNYIMDGNDIYGLGNILVTKVPIHQAAPESIVAQRLWIVSLRDTININRTADDRTHQLIDKYNCPLVSYLQYPQSLDVEVYLCDLHQK